MLILDCTLRDGGYYNNWNFPLDVTNEYLQAMNSCGVDIVELGLRSMINKGFKGANAYTTEKYLQTLSIPDRLKVAVMVNASELVNHTSLEDALESLFELNAADSLVDVVRIACHVHEFEEALPAASWLKERGFLVGFNLMQIAERSQDEVELLAERATDYPIDALYFADSMGSMNPSQTREIITWLRKHWKGQMGIHTHDNLGLALQNTLEAIENGVTWLDSTVTGMGRGPGNARTEELAIEIAEVNENKINLVPLLSLINRFFQPLKNECRWGSNPYYYLAGKYGIHPTYIQEMQSDSRYSEEDIIAAIDKLKEEGGKKFSFNTLDATRHFYSGEALGHWQPKTYLQDKDILILGAGPSVHEHRAALEDFILDKKPTVMALNTQSVVSEELVEYRLASHPIRILADCETHLNLGQPLITPASMMPSDIRKSMESKELLDFGISVEPGRFEFSETSVVVPNSLVLSYALAIAGSGGARRIYLAGFDGYGAEDPRTREIQSVFDLFQDSSDIPIVSLLDSEYMIETASIYGM